MGGAAVVVALISEIRRRTTEYMSLLPLLCVLALFEGMEPKKEEMERKRKMRREERVRGGNEKERKRSSIEAFLIVRRVDFLRFFPVP